jgi:transcriptional regulator with XRE-family HTH domain
MGSEVVENIGELVKAARKQRGLSQEALAYRVGVEQTDISKIERGRDRPREEKARKLALALGLPEDNFLRHS